jgi:hypothetical protein
MKKILLTLLLSIISSQSISAVGDVYFCDTSKYLAVEYDSISKSKSKFKFKWEEDQVVFSQSLPIFEPIPIYKDAKYYGVTADNKSRYGRVEAFHASDIHSWLIYYKNGVINMALIDADGIGVDVIIANCTPF